MFELISSLNSHYVPALCKEIPPRSIWVSLSLFFLSASPLWASQPEFALEVTATGHDTIQLSWEADPGSTGYTVERSQDLQNWSVVGNVDSTTHTWGDSGLEEATLYQYRIRSGGDPESFSNWAYDATLVRLDASQTIPRLVAQWEGSSVHIRWDERFADETGFEIQRVTSGVTNHVATVAANTTEVLDAAPGLEQTHTYLVKALGVTEDSQVASTTACTRLFYLNDHNQFFPFSPYAMTASVTPPSQFAATWTDHNTIEFTWQDNSNNESRFMITKAWEAQGDYVVLDSTTISANATSYTFKGALPITTYHFKLYAVNASNQASVAVDLVLPPPQLDATLEIPQNLTFTPQPGGMKLDWDAVPGATAYVVETAQSNSRVRFETLATVATTTYTSSSTSLFLDYRVRAIGPSGTGYATAYEDASVSSIVSDPASPPGNFAVVSNVFGNIQLQWDVIANYNGHYLIQRSCDGAPFELVGSASKANVADTSVQWDDPSVRPGHVYVYRVGAESSAAWRAKYTSPLRVEAAAETAIPGAPTNGSAAVRSESHVELTWTPNVQATSLEIERNLNGGGYVLLTTLAGQASSHSDTDVSSGDSVSYRIRSRNGLGDSGWATVNAGTVSGNVPVVTTSTTTYRGFTTLHVLGTDVTEQIDVAMSGQDVVVTVNGSAQAPLSDIHEIKVHGQGGDDTLSVASSVSLPVLLYGGDGNDVLIANGLGYQGVVALGHGRDTVSGTGPMAHFWIDPCEIDTAQVSLDVYNENRVHRISAFENGADKDLDSPSISDPSSYPGSLTTYPNQSMFGDGPTLFDVDQGLIQNCPFTCVYQGIADGMSHLLYGLGVDLGDGTYAVRTEGAAVRIDGEFWTFSLSMPGPNGFIWWLILEKVYYSYSSPSYGSPSRSDERSRIHSGLAPDTIYQEVRNALADNRLITSFTPTGELMLHARMNAQHAHTILQAYEDKDGNKWVVVRNPYGQQTEHNNPDLADPFNGLITMSLDQVKANFADINTVRIVPELIDPVADAGPASGVEDADENGEQAASLNGANSTDSDGVPTAYIWSVEINGEPQVAIGETSSLTLPVGTHIVTLNMIDDDSRRDSAEVSVTVTGKGQNAPASYWTWIANNGLTGDNTLPNQNKDGDPLSNWDEFTFGSDPDLVESTFQGILNVYQGSGGPSVTFHRRKDASSQNILYDVYTCNALGDPWVKLTPVVTIASIDDAYESVTFTFSPSDPLTFFRVEPVNPLTPAP